MGMIILFGLVGGLAILALIALGLSYLTSISFSHWMLILPLVLLALSACSMSISWIKERNQDTGLPLTLIDEKTINPHWLLPRRNSDDLTAEEKAEQQQADKVLMSPRWSHSSVASTTDIKISKSETPQLLSTDIWNNDEGHYGYQISYPKDKNANQPQDRFFITEHIIKPECGVNTRLLSWAGQLTDKNNAIELLANETVGGMTVVGVDKNQTIINVSYRYHSERQIFLFDHASGEMQAITKKHTMASAKLEWGDVSNYMLVSRLNSGEILLALYHDEKNYDDFFSSRGRYLPTITQLLRISDNQPQSKLLSRLRLEQQGMLIALKQGDNNELILETLDQRDVEKPVLRHFSVKI
ncbi:hypothetical protein [Bacterioplanoides sp.]|uniref:hypothetical protein n=1 Tax=Bacterioplanoides sp. TaxID=2066072 RepID=UPI003B59BBA5